MPAVCGLRVRPVVSCPGNNTCPYGLLNTRTLAEKLDAQSHNIGFRGAAEPLIDHELCVKCGACVQRCPAKSMVIESEALSIDYDKCLSCGVCVRVCPKQALQYGRIGYHIYVGGKGGRYTNEGEITATFVTEEQVISYLEAILAVYQEMADQGQRLSAVISKYGQRR
nr:4Fe-4S dicluster domain-containing protein [Sporomusa sphaeroides]